MPWSCPSVLPQQLGNTSAYHIVDLVDYHIVMLSRARTSILKRFYFLKFQFRPTQVPETCLPTSDMQTVCTDRAENLFRLDHSHFLQPNCKITSHTNKLVVPPFWSRELRAAIPAGVSPGVNITKLWWFIVELRKTKRLNCDFQKIIWGCKVFSEVKVSLQGRVV